MGRGCVSPLPACAVIVAFLCSAAAAQDRRAGGSVFETPLPGGIGAALAALDDRAAPDRSQFLLEVIRRFYSAPSTPNPHPRLAPLRSLLARLDAASSDAPRDTLPLPLPPEMWIEVVFDGRATPETLVSAILRSRNASLLYCALLSLDDETREWLMSRRDVVASLATTHTAGFLVAAPGVRVKHGRMDLPGGEAARSAWLTLAGVKTDDPGEFIRRVVDVGDGRLAFFLGAMSQLSAAQLRFALKLDSADPGDRVAAARQLYAIFEHVAAGWDIDGRPFLRPPLDPALLLSDLPLDEHGRPILRGTREFWRDAFAADTPETRNEPREGATARETASPVDFGWLCERVFARSSRPRPREYDAVLFASRHLEWFAPQAQPDTLESIRAARQYPALTAALERAGLEDASAFAAASRRAARLNTIGDGPHAIRALLQFQGALAVITRAAVRGDLRPDVLSSLVSSLAAIDVSKAGDYEGRLLRWLESHAPPAVNSPAGRGPAHHDSCAPAGENGLALETQLLQLLSASPAVNPQIVEWEGTHYRVDLSTAEATRLERLLGDEPRPFISCARAVVSLADTLEDRSAGPETRRAAAAAFAQIGETVGADLQDDDAQAYRDMAGRLPRAARTADPGAAARLAPALRVFADSLLARGLLELTYAVALGQPGAVPISASEAAIRHDFRMFNHAPSTWELPEAGAAPTDWHVTGSLLGLDVRLAAFSLMRVSSRPPPRRPSLDDFDRRVFTEAVSLVEPAALGESRRDALLAALRTGRSRLAAAREPSDVLTLADEIRLSPARRTLLAWAITHEPGRVAAGLSLAELLWLGAGPTQPPAAFDAWGAAAESRLGCLCLRLIDRRPWETLAGRWNTGILASGFPDLNLRLAELLDELQMPAALLGPVLAAATADFVENADSRDNDDRRGLVEFVQGLKRERVEEYLALLTTDGPLVPVDVANPASRSRSPR